MPQPTETYLLENEPHSEEYNYTKSPVVNPWPREHRHALRYEFERDDQFETAFRAAVEEWRRQSEHLSSITKMIALPSYRRIIDMGKPVIPLLLRELKERPHFWFAALREITGENDIGKGAEFKDAMDAWLTWGRSHHY